MEQMPVIKTLVWKQAGNLSLCADVFVRPNIKPGEKRPLAMLFHGGGHVMFSRQQVNPKQVALLLGHGVLPVGFDYRLCPELNVLDGALDPRRLYWHLPVLLITRVNIASYLPAVRPGSMTLADLRCRFILHMIWRGQTVPFLLRGTSYDPSDTTFPATAEVQSISPYAHILSGGFRTPTSLLHGRIDDLIPWQQSMRTIEMLKEKGVEADVEVVDGAAHLFDSFPQPGVDFEAKVARGYAWLRKVVFRA